MSPRLSQRLFATYPKIFVPSREGISLTGTEDRIQCGDGWFVIIDALCAALQNETDASGAPQLVAGMVKHKFGSLRFQAVGPRSECQSGMIRMAAELSTRLPED